jgi:hypothetical protein
MRLIQGGWHPLAIRVAAQVWLLRLLHHQCALHVVILPIKPAHAHSVCEPQRLLLTMSMDCWQSRGRCVAGVWAVMPSSCR